jgi:hypothetical protein
MKKISSKWALVIAALVGAVAGPKAQELILQLLASFG